MGNFLLLLLYLDCITNQSSIPFGYLLHLLVQGHQGPFVSPGVFLAMWAAHCKNPGVTGHSVVCFVFYKRVLWVK
jgi:hypothetical protein